MFYNVYELHRIIPISVTRCLIEMGFGSKYGALNGQMIDIEKSKLNIANMWLIPLDRATDTYSSLVDIIEPLYQVSDCTLATSTTSNQSHWLANIHIKIQPFQDLILKGRKNSTFCD